MAEWVNLVHCGALDAELRRLVTEGTLQAYLRPLPSGLCVDHRSLGKALRKTLAHLPQPVVLCMGECLPAIDRLASGRNTKRVQSINCISMLLGEEAYRRGLDEGVFYLLPEWAERWRVVFEQQLGMTAAMAGELFGALREAVYLDTGVKPVPSAALTSFELYSHLKVRTKAVSLARLSNLLSQTAQGLLCAEVACDEPNSHLGNVGSVAWRGT